MREGSQQTVPGQGAWSDVMIAMNGSARALSFAARLFALAWLSTVAHRVVAFPTSSCSFTPDTRSSGAISADENHPYQVPVSWTPRWCARELPVGSLCFPAAEEQSPCSSEGRIRTDLHQQLSLSISRCDRARLAVAILRGARSGAPTRVPSCTQDAVGGTITPGVGNLGRRRSRRCRRSRGAARKGNPM